MIATAHCLGCGAPESSASALSAPLPPELSAHEPPEAAGRQRDEVRLLVTGPAASGAPTRVSHATFRDLPGVLRAGDLLVVNHSATVPAALRARRPNGEPLALHYSGRRPATGTASPTVLFEPRRLTPTGHAPHAPLSPGDRLALPGGATAHIDARHVPAHAAPRQRPSRLWVATLSSPLPLVSYLLRHGEPIRYDYVPRPWPLSSYQTVFAREAGSAEMPSAGRPFSARVVAALRTAGVRLAAVVLHTGVSSLEAHEPPYAEYFRVPRSTAAAIRRTHARGGRVIAVGTTVVRALESAADGGVVRPREGWTDLIVTPARGVRVIDGLLTGLHPPEASHLQLLEAVAGRAHLEIAYAAARAAGYRWHEFGDVHLLLGRPPTVG